MVIKMEDIIKKIYDYSLEEIMGERFGKYSKYWFRVVTCFAGVVGNCALSAAKVGSVNIDSRISSFFI